MNQITIHFSTNFNNKLECDAFLHLGRAPKEGIPEKQMKDTVIEIRTNDKSHAPVKAVLVDLCRIRLGDVRSIITFASHGMEYPDYLEYIISEEYYDKNSEMAVYFYKKVAE